MARQFSPSHFFRNVPKPLLARFFQEKHQVLLDVDFDTLKKPDYDPIMKAYTALPDDKASEIEAELQNVEGMACQGGIAALCDEAASRTDKAFAASIAELCNGQQKPDTCLGSVSQKFPLEFDRGLVAQC